jgi:hypothetical protein
MSKEIEYQVGAGIIRARSYEEAVAKAGLAETKHYEHAKACVQFVEDARAFCSWAIGAGQSSQFIASTLMHDIGGLHRREDCFTPRVDGYAAREREQDRQGAADWQAERDNERAIEENNDRRSGIDIY